MQSDTGNLGVSALLLRDDAGAVCNFPRWNWRCWMTAGASAPAGRRSDGREVCYSLIGGALSRRYWRPESCGISGLSSWLGGLANPAARAIRGGRRLLDISGGDSFTDLYGQRRFNTVTLF